MSDSLRGRRLIPIAILLVFSLAVSGFRADVRHAAQKEKPDAEVKREIIAASIASYSGNCPCPYSSDRAGRRCGGRSAYSRPGGAAPFCYPHDVTQKMLDAYRKRTRR